MMRALTAAMLAFLGGAALVLALWARAESSGLRPQRGGQGVAIVVNARLAPSPELPDLNDLVADPAGVAAAFEARGLDVVTDPTGRCLALLSPAQLPADGAELAALSSPALAAVILAYATPEQMASRKSGYLQARTLSSIQRAAAQEVGRRHRLFDASGRPAYTGAQLVVGIWRTWRAHAYLRQGERTVSEMVEPTLYPPTTAAVAAPPLTGSMLWWSWPHAEATWGDRAVSMGPGIYALSDLLRELTRRGAVEAPRSGVQHDARLGVAAQDIAVRRLLWAVQVALGPEVVLRCEAAGGRVSVTYSSEADASSVGDRPRPVWRRGYYNPSASAVGPDLLAKGKGAPDDPDWVGWRFADLPLLYRSSVEGSWGTRSRLRHREVPRALDPDRTVVLWTQAAVVCVQLQLAEGGWNGPEFYLPAL